MLIAIKDFGSVWRRKFSKNQKDPRRFAHGVYYNTTGVEIAGAVRQRPSIPGYVRFHECGGFDPNRPDRMIGRVFDCADPCIWQGDNKLLAKRVLSAPQIPDAFLVVMRPELTGRLTVGSKPWRSSGSWLISLSECGSRQEAMVLLPTHGWIQTELGRFVLAPDTARPWLARLVLTLAEQE